MEVRIMAMQPLFKMISNHLMSLWFRAVTLGRSGLWIQAALGTSTPNKDLFEELCDQDGGSVLLGSNKACKIADVGSMRFKLHDESIRLLIEVKYVPDLKRNLLSLGEFDKKGFVFSNPKFLL